MGGVGRVRGAPRCGFVAAGCVRVLAVTGCAQLVGQPASKHLRATKGPLLVSRIILLEIPGAAVLAAVFLHETLPGGTYGGLGLILVGLAVVVLGQMSGLRNLMDSSCPLADEPQSGRLPDLGS